jgi:hypothetical protein
MGGPFWFWVNIKTMFSPKLKATRKEKFTNLCSYVNPRKEILLCLFKAETHLEASRDIGLEINTEETKYMIVSCFHNSGQNQNIRIANESFENVIKFK